ncbi:MAG: nitrilase-related carbon-nitrogen hydrolase [Bacteroidota bacterium]|jgi:predicted amidohydrolase
MKVAVVQTEPIFGEVASNVKEALLLMGSADANIFVLPELFNTGYNFTDLREVQLLSERSNGNTFQSIAGFAKKKSCFVVYGFVEQVGKFYNSAALVGPDGIVGLYRKVHLYNRENLFFASGDFGFPVFELPFGKVGIMICFDWIYPESARSLALGGAQLIAHPSNLVMPYCPEAMVTRCLENRVFAATADRIGEEERGGVKFCYIGQSEVVSPKGEILTRLGENKAGISVVDVDLSLANNKRVNEFNDLLRDRKVEQYKQ